MYYECDHCQMQIAALVCHQCQQPLVHSSIEVDGEAIAVSVCASCEGMVKSPVCCGHDMVAK